MLACIDSLPFKFHSPGQPNMGGDNQQNRRVTKEEQRAFKRIDTPVREHATDKQYREGRVMHDPDAFHQPGERGYSKSRHPKIIPGHKVSRAAPPGKRSMN